METTNWLQQDSKYQKVDDNFNTVNQPPVGIYNLEISKSGWYLDKFTDKFVFDYKIYGLQEEFCNHVLKTYQNTSGNFGIMLTGTKGTGKTVTAKVLSNNFNLPIIIVKDMGEMNQSMIEFIGQFNFDCVLFFDEFEKNFKESDSTILQIMDGVYNSIYRKIFLLTSNEMTINTSLIGRPSRLRYVRKFGNLEFKVVEEYLKDNLKISEAHDELIKYIDTLSISTIDILKNIVDEVNIHGIEGLKLAKEFFNVSLKSFEYICITGYAYENNILQNKNNYSIESFLKEVDWFFNPVPRPYEDEDYFDLTEEQQKEVDEYTKKYTGKFCGVSSRIVKSSIEFKNLQRNDIFEQNNSIVNVDFDKKVVIAKNDRVVYFYYVTNPNSKPSLYNNRFVY